MWQTVKQRPRGSESWLTNFLTVQNVSHWTRCIHNNINDFFFYFVWFSDSPPGKEEDEAELPKENTSLSQLATSPVASEHVPSTCSRSDPLDTPSLSSPTPASDLVRPDLSHPNHHNPLQCKWWRVNILLGVRSSSLHNLCVLLNVMNCFFIFCDLIIYLMFDF